MKILKLLETNAYFNSVAGLKDLGGCELIPLLPWKPPTILSFLIDKVIE